MKNSRRVALVLAPALLALVLFANPSPAQNEPGFKGEYRLAVGDRVQIAVKDHEELDQTYSVPANGEVSFPPLGRVKLLGKTTSDLESEIATMFVQAEELTNPKIFVLIEEYAPRNAFLFGAVTREINLPVHTDYTLLRVLAMAGASPATFDLRKVKIIRKRQRGESFSFLVNVEDAIERDDFASDVVVMPDDIIVISSFETIIETSWVYILGKVNRPGRYSFIPGREEMTLMKIIAQAGDFNQFADEGSIKILRKEGRRPITPVKEIDFDDIIDGDIPDFLLQADDIVFVPESPF